MHGIVSLLDSASDQAVRALWAELEARYGLRFASQQAPYPHTSYQIAEDYDLARLAPLLARVARQTEPFTIHLRGLAVFDGPEPVLFLAVERNAALDALHARLWGAIASEDAARGVSPLYRAERWVPHVTLAMGDLTPATLRAILAGWSGRDMRREARLSDLTLLYQAAGQPTYEPALRYVLGDSAD